MGSKRRTSDDLKRLTKVADDLAREIAREQVRRVDPTEYTEARVAELLCRARQRASCGPTALWVPELDGDGR